MYRPRKRCSRKGFTLIELMIVVAIIALLIAILLPSLARAREQAMQVACAANMDALFKGMFYYSEDPQNGNGYLPQLGWRWNMYPGSFWTNQISKYIAIKRTRAGSKNGLTVCPAHDNPPFMHVVGDQAGNGANMQEKIRCDTGQSGGTRRRGGSGGGGGASFDCHIEPLSYSGTCDALETVVVPQLGGGAQAFPLKWTEIERPHCFMLLTEASGDRNRALCFRMTDLVNEAQRGNADDYRRHYGGASPFSNGSNFLFADGHAQWQSANFTATKMICCMDFSGEGGNQSGARGLQESQCGSAGGGGTRRR